MDTQFRVAMGGTYGLDYNTVDRRALAAGIPLDSVYYAKVRAYETTALEIINGKSGKDICDEEFCRFQYGDLFEWTCAQCKEIKKI